MKGEMGVVNVCRLLGNYPEPPPKFREFSHLRGLRGAEDARRVPFPSLFAAEEKVPTLRSRGIYPESQTLNPERQSPQGWQVYCGLRWCTPPHRGVKQHPHWTSSTAGLSLQLFGAAEPPCSCFPSLIL